MRVSAGSVYEAVAALSGKHPVGQQDLLIAYPATEAHLPLIQAGRQWHKVSIIVHLKTVVHLLELSKL